MTIRQLIAASLLTLTAAGSAFAHADTPRVDHRQGHQMARVHQGIVSGRLTPHEANHLRHELRAVAHLERRVKADGVVTARERQALHRAQARVNRDIYRETHDRQGRR